MTQKIMCAQLHGLERKIDEKTKKKTNMQQKCEKSQLICDGSRRTYSCHCFDFYTSMLTDINICQLLKLTA